MQQLVCSMQLVSYHLEWLRVVEHDHSMQEIELLKVDYLFLSLFFRDFLGPFEHLQEDWQLSCLARQDLNMFVRLRSARKFPTVEEDNAL